MAGSSSSLSTIGRVLLFVYSFVVVFSFLFIDRSRRGREFPHGLSSCPCSLPLSLRHYYNVLDSLTLPRIIGSISLLVRMNLTAIFLVFFFFFCLVAHLKNVLGLFSTKRVMTVRQAINSRKEKHKFFSGLFDSFVCP